MEMLYAVMSVVGGAIFGVVGVNFASDRGWFKRRS